MRSTTVPHRRLSLWLVPGILLAAALTAVAAPANGAAPPPKASRCPVTQGNAGDGAYRANAPLRSRIGTGFVLSGILRSGIDCAAIVGAHVEFWRAGPNGYDDAHRGIITTDGNGRYRFESDAASANAGFRPHIHLRVAVPGYRTLVVTFFLPTGAPAATLDLVLDPDV